MDTDESETVVLEDAEELPQAGTSHSTPSVIQSTLVKTPKRRSAIFAFFTHDLVANTFKCNKCCPKNTIYKLPPSGSNGALIRHMRNMHNVDVNKLDVQEIETTSSTSIKKYFQRDQRKASEKVTKEGFRQQLLKFLVIGNKPFTTVEEEAFRDLISYCGQNKLELEIPCAKTVSKDMVQKYQHEKMALKALLHKIKSKLSFIIDGWGSPSGAFQGVIVQWISDDWKMRSLPLDLTILEGTHTGANLAAAFAKVLDDFELWDKILGITTDNASNMDTFFEEFTKLANERNITFDPENQRVRCLAHIINLVAKSILYSLNMSESIDLARQAVDSEESEESNSDSEEEKANPKTKIKISKTTVGKIRKAVKKIRSSPQRKNDYMAQCTAATVRAKQVILDVDTRWNSTYAMLVRATEMRVPLENTLATRADLRKYQLSNDCWDKVEILLPVLKPMKELTMALSTGSSPTISKCASTYQSLFDHFNGYINSTTKACHPDWLSHAVLSGQNKLEKYYRKADGMVYVVSTVLDPRYKLAWFKAVGWPQDWISSYSQIVRKAWAAYKPEPFSTNCSNNTTGAATTGEALLMKQMSKFSSAAQEDELKKYLAAKPVSVQSFGVNKIQGSLEWWKIHEAEFPNLARMAKDYLPVSGTGVPAEQFFSNGPDVLTHRRKGMMKTETQRISLCLKAWLSFGTMSDKEEMELHKTLLKGVEAKAYGFEAN